MSNAGIEKSRGEFIQMDPCATCHKDWGMYESEKQFFENLVKTSGYKMPKNCPDCRKIRRREKELRGDRVSIPLLIDRIAKLSSNANEDMYTFGDEGLCEELDKIIESLKLFMRQNPRFFKKESNDQKES